jgi:hypothetical protein
MLDKWYVVALLLFIACPAGCLPVFTLGIAGSEVAETAWWKRRPHNDGFVQFLIEATVFSLLAIVAIWAFRWRLRRVREIGDSDAITGLGRTAWYTVLWTGFAIGGAIGGYMCFLILTV